MRSSDYDIDCRTNEYVESALAARGFVRDPEAEKRLRAAGRCSHWKHTLMVYRRK